MALNTSYNLSYSLLLYKLSFGYFLKSYAYIGIVDSFNKNSKFIYYPKCEQNFKEFVTCSSPEWNVFLRKGRGNSSRQIWRKCASTGQEINTNLRLRIVLNNGVGALCGFSKSNKNSSICLKIQQENVENHLKSLVGASTEEFQGEGGAEAQCEH